MTQLIVVSSSSISSNTNNDNHNDTNTTINDNDYYKLDTMDEFNHPRQRRDCIIYALRNEQYKYQKQKQVQAEEDDDDNYHNIVNIVFKNIIISKEDVDQIQLSLKEQDESEVVVVASNNNNDNNNKDTDQEKSLLYTIYSVVHSYGLISFLQNAWKRWIVLGENGRDPIGCSYSSNTNKNNNTNNNNTKDEKNSINIPYLIPACTPLLRYNPQNSNSNKNQQQQRPSQHVIGQMGYYCTDTCTPIFSELIYELYNDARLIQYVLQQIVPILKQQQNTNRTTLSQVPIVPTYYILPNHPGHHASYDCFGGYCYLNHIAAIAKHISLSMNSSDNNVIQNEVEDDDKEKEQKHNQYNNNQRRVVILDIDYHCGNGTAAIFDTDDNILVISIHCDPNYDYPFHMGYADENDDDDIDNINNAKTLHIPLLPGTGWETGYRNALIKALDRIEKFNPCIVLISLGLDTYINDPCAIRRAGFTLQCNDYIAIGQLLGESISSYIPVIFVQEGGYRMDTIGQAASNVVVAFTQQRTIQQKQNEPM